MEREKERKAAEEQALSPASPSLGPLAPLVLPLAEASCEPVVKAATRET